jgi:hypothetical protein
MTALVAALFSPRGLQVDHAGAAHLDPQAHQLPADPGRTGEADPPAGGPREGIQVHGAWTIDVHNPDGSLASRTEFENALQGGLWLSQIMARGAAVGRWEVNLLANTGNLCGSSGRCVVTESGAPDGDNVFKTLSVSAPFSGTDATKLVLRGTAVASVSNTIHRVETLIWLCSEDIAPSACPTHNSPSNVGTQFTGATLGTPVSVSAGQTIDVTVRISWS